MNKRFDSLTETPWFYWHQPLLLEMAKMRDGRWLLGIPDDLPKITQVHVNSFTARLTGVQQLSTFYSGATQANRIRLFWKEYLELKEFIERREWRELEKQHEAFERRVGRRIPMIAGGTDSDFFPEPDPEVLSVDGLIRVTPAGGAIWATIRAANGDIRLATGATGNACQISTTVTIDEWERFARGLFRFDFSTTIGSDNVDSGTFNLFLQSKQDDFTSSVSLVEGTLGSIDELAITDFEGNVNNTTKFATDIAIADMTADDTVYTVWTLNSTGVAHVETNKGDGANFCIRITEDSDDNEPTWEGNDDSLINTAFADQTGTTEDPMLSITHTEGGGPEVIHFRSMTAISVP